MFSRGILQTRPEVFHPDYFVVRMCCQGLKPGKLVSIEHHSKSDLTAVKTLRRRFPFQVLASKVWRHCRFILGNFSFCGLVDADLPDLEDGGEKNAKRLRKNIVNSMELLLELCFQMEGNGHQLSSGKTCQADEEEDM